ncbi:immunoglobulin-binding protein 1b-like [Varroa destructor]|uniref:Immunoglobulin-binding protein 1 n=2 Tax=Varroa TaxID=62624 RepID=A0A7M7K9P0_VARDE|nr:immunoglobulin-binding protein 1b-like [Varroa destructor]
MLFTFSGPISLVSSAIRNRAFGEQTLEKQLTSTTYCVSNQHCQSISFSGISAVMEQNQETISLDVLFKFALNAAQEIEHLTPQDVKYDQLVKESIEKLEHCTELVNELHLFSVNESFEEIATPVLKFLLLPALLASFSSRKKDDRLLLINQSEIYFKDFLKRCSEYGITKWEEKNGDVEEQKKTDRSLVDAAHQRNIKIERYKEQQRLESIVLEFEESLEKNGATSTPEDEVREYYLSLVRLWCLKAVNELALVEQEKAILQHIRSLPNDAKAKEETAPKRPFKPFIITKTAEQKKVYGAGYPSLPVLSVDEFYEQKYGKDGKSGENSHCPGGHSLQRWAENPEANQQEIENEAAEKENKMEREDPEELARQRAWDDWKDEHRRGEGNRKNMG